MGNLFINVLISVLLGIVIFVIICRKSDLRVDEILISMIAGLCAVYPAILLIYALSLKSGAATGLFKTFIDAFIIAALIEESAKFLVIKLLFVIKKINNLRDGIATAIAVGAGFACLENIMYSFDSSLIVMFRIFTAIPLHIIAAGVMGYFSVKSIRSRSRSIRGFGEAFLLHGFYNFLIALRSFISFLAVPLLFLAGYRLYKLSKNADSDC